MNSSMKKFASLLLLGFLTHNMLLQTKEDEKKSSVKKPDSLALVGAKSAAAAASLTAMAGSLLATKLAIEFIHQEHQKDPQQLSDGRLVLLGLAKPQANEEAVRVSKGLVLLGLYGTLASGYLTYKFGKSAYKSYLTR